MGVLGFWVLTVPYKGDTGLLLVYIGVHRIEVFWMLGVTTETHQHRNTRRRPPEKAQRKRPGIDGVPT